MFIFIGHTEIAEYEHEASIKVFISLLSNFVAIRGFRMLTSFSIDVPLVSDCRLHLDFCHRFLDRGRSRGGGRGINHHWMMVAIDNNRLGDYEPISAVLLAALIAWK